jgi:hypothetical protein
MIAQLLLETIFNDLNINNSSSNQTLWVKI